MSARYKSLFDGSFFRTVLMGSLIAPALTMLIVACASFFSDISWTIHEQHMPPAEQALFGHPQLMEAVQNGLLSFLAAAPLGVLFGFFGALIFLLPSFSIVRLCGNSPTGYAFAGLLAGMAHTALGFGLSDFAHLAIARSYGEITAYVSLVGGFILTGFPFSAKVIVIAAPLAGLATGVFAGRYLSLDRAILPQVNP